MLKYLQGSDCMDLLFATGNENKYNLMKRRLSSLDDINVLMPKQIGVKINVVEDGKTAEENAIKKAQEYYNKTGMAVIAEDSGLYVDKFNENMQPGLFVRRVNGREDLTDHEILNYYINCLNIVDGESLAHYQTGVALIDADGNIYSMTIDEEPFLFTSKKNQKDTVSGGTLDSISYDIKNKKYFNELTNDEKQQRYERIDQETLKLVSNLKKHIK